MHTIAVTGGAGLVGRYVVRRLLDNEQIAEVRILDRQTVTSLEENRRIKLFTLDLNDRKSVENALKGCDTVVHCAHSEFPIFYEQDKEKVRNMWKDNLDATESVVDVMKSLNIQNLVNVGCAYCPIPNEDNYGLAQEVFLDFPRNYMLDEYGESRTRGEMYARKVAQRNEIKAVFLRPCFVYGQGRSQKMEAIQKLIENEELPSIEGERRGMHQFIFAGNLAGIIEKAIFKLFHQPEILNGEIVFCMDETCAFPIREFFEKRFGDKFLSSKNVNYWAAFGQSYMNYWKNRLGFEVPENNLNHVAFRLFFEKSVGFPDKKLRLLLDWKTETSQEKAFAKYATPKSRFVELESTKRTNNQG